MVLCFVSPGNFNNGNANVRFVDSGGNGSYYVSVFYLDGVRPTINLKADSLKMGSGTMDDPWRIVD